MSRIRLFRKQVETLIGDLLGQYVLSNGATRDSIDFREGNEPLDENTAVSGLEVILGTEAPVKEAPSYDGFAIRDIYTIRMVQWTDFNYDEAVKRILKAYDNATIATISVPPGLGPQKQCLIRIPSSSFDIGEIKIVAP